MTTVEEQSGRPWHLLSQCYACKVRCTSNNCWIL